MNAVVKSERPDEAREVAVLPPRSPTPADLLSQALNNGADLTVIEKFMDLKDRWEKTEAEKAFNEAVAEFKANPPKVLKDLENKQYGSRYTSLANLVNTVNKAMSPFGLTARWDISQTTLISVTCVLSHVQGHKESVTLSGPADTSGSKNALQQIKSTITYLKGATFEAVTGVASEAGSVDDDGNAAGEDYDATEWLDAIKDAADKVELDKLGDQLKKAQGIPAGALKGIRQAWAARARELAK